MNDIFYNTLHSGISHFFLFPPTDPVVLTLNANTARYNQFGRKIALVIAPLNFPLCSKQLLLLDLIGYVTCIPESVLD